MKIALSRLGWLRYVPLLAIFCLILGCPAAKEDTKKGREVPDAETLAAKKKEILELFKEKDPEDLPKIFLEKGKQTKDDLVARCALFELARDYAAKGGGADDIDHALQAVDELAKSFDVDLLEGKRDTIGKLVESVKSSDLNYDLTNESLKLVDGAEKEKKTQQNCVESDRYDIANALLDFAEATRKKVKPSKDVSEDDIKMLEAKVAATKKKIQEMEKEFESAKPARDTLESKPDTKDANLTWGKYLCTIKGDWEKGLPLLEKSEDPELAPLAKKELAKPGTGDEQVKMGDEWWGLADKESGMARQQLKKRAVFWYKKAESSVSGFTQERIRKCIREVEAKG